MTIKIWQSYSCNNSSAYRLVARFADAAAAKAAATDLDAFFKAHAKEMDEYLDESDGEWPERWLPGAIAFAKKHGFKLSGEPLGWGDSELIDDEPDVLASDDVLLVYHPYCAGGFGPVPAFLAARGATKMDETDDGPSATVMFSYAGGNKKLDGELNKLFAQVTDELRLVEPLESPWKSRGVYGTAVFHRDAKTVAMAIPIVPEDLANIRAWLAKRGIDNPSIRVCENGDEELALVAIAGATCDACERPLELWHPRLHDVDAAQMACTACGGLYDISTFVAAEKQRERARKRAEAKMVQEVLAGKPAAKKPAAKKPAAKTAAKTAKTAKTAKKPAAKKPAVKKPAAKKPAAKKPAAKK